MDRALCSAGLQISTRYLQFSLRSASAAGGRRWRASEKKQRWRSWIQIGVECPTSVLGGRRCLAYGEIQAFPIGLATCKLVQVVRWALWDLGPEADDLMFPSSLQLSGVSAGIAGADPVNIEVHL